MQPRLDQPRAALAEAERRLADAAEGPRQRELEEARAALAGAESALETGRREFERVDQLVERKLPSASSRDEARARRDAGTRAGTSHAHGSGCCRRVRGPSRSAQPSRPCSGRRPCSPSWNQRSAL